MAKESTVMGAALREASTPLAVTIVFWPDVKGNIVFRVV
jgi:hypothetical protein